MRWPLALAMLLRYVENGAIRLDETLAEIGIDDRSALLPLERTARVGAHSPATRRRTSTPARA